MKRIFFVVAALFYMNTAFSQAPEAFKYQAVVRNATGTILTNQPVGMRLTILQGSASGSSVYSETFSVTSNNYGLVNLEIGNGITTDDFAAIDWANGPFFIETAVDIAGGTNYSVLGNSQLISVPYALYAKQAESSVIDLVDDADADPTNEIETWTTLSGIPADFSDDVDNVDDADADPANEIQDINLIGNDLTITSGSTVDLSGYLDDTDAQTLSLTGTTLSISNGNSVVINEGDITEVLAGNGLTGGGSNGSLSLDVNASNGLTVDGVADAVKLGGALTESTTIVNGGFNLTHNLSGTGDFIIQDAGTNLFEVRDNGSMYVGNDTYWSDVNTSGTLIGAMFDDADDGRFWIYENGLVSVDLDANTQFVFNEQGLDRDFRVEGDGDPNALMVNAGLDNVGIGTATPLAKLHVVNGAIMPQFGNGLTAGIRWQDNAFGGGGDEAYLQYISEVGENTVLRLTNNNDWDDDIALNQLGADRLVIHNGNVGIGTSIPAFQLEVATNSAAKPTSNVWTVTSDRRLKKDIVPYTNGLEDIMLIEPVWFTYNGQAGMPQERGVGVIAQDLQKVAPYMIKTWQYRDTHGSTTEYLGVDNGAMTYMLINAVQEQQEIINGQQTEIDTLKETLLKMEQRLKALEKE